MRIDKFLWCVRLFKTRSLAQEEVSKERVWVRDEPVKPSREIKVGDTITLRRHGYFQQFQVLDLPKSRVGAPLVVQLLLETTPAEELEKKEMLSLAKALTRPAGDGRPTKKDRRQLDELTG
jgi:ribosome-associated heat shock protein Hsp15